LFAKGKSISAFPLKMLYDFTSDNTAPIKAGVTTSSRTFKKAVERNRVKRLLREAYRLQKAPIQMLLQQKQLTLTIFFIYTGKELPVYKEVFEKMGILLSKLIDTVMKKRLG
jgi:ribonuclease P protein component